MIKSSDYRSLYLDAEGLRNLRMVSGAPNRTSRLFTKYTFISTAFYSTSVLLPVGSIPTNMDALPVEILSLFQAFERAMGGEISKKGGTKRPYSGYRSLGPMT